jgi:hypothetical protein
MANITIDRGESVSLGFEINGIVIADLLDLQIYVGDWVFKLSNGTIEQDAGNDKLFYVRLNSTRTYSSGGTKTISLAVVTDLLGVNKQSNIASLIVKETNQRTVLDDLANYIAGTFVVTIDLDQINTNVILENIYRVQSVNAVDSVNGQTGVVVLDADDITESATRLFLTPAQSSNINVNNAKVGYTEALVNANSSVVANTAKVGITTGQASAITTNTAKVGITTTQASNITTNNAKVGITPTQSTAITTNTATFLIATATVELDSTLTNFFYAPRNLRINTTTNISGTPTVTIKVNGVAYTLTNLISQGALITLNSNVIGVVNLNISYE